MRLGIRVVFLKLNGVENTNQERVVCRGTREILSFRRPLLGIASPSTHLTHSTLRAAPSSRSIHGKKVSANTQKIQKEKVTHLCLYYTLVGVSKRY